MLASPCTTGNEMQKQFQNAYTTAKFKDIQQELMGKICCDLYSNKTRVNITENEIDEDVIFQESLRCATFQICFNEDTNEAKCNCQLFECKGILCKHQIAVFLHS